MIVAHENCPGAATVDPADRSRTPIANNAAGGSASSTSPVAAVDDHAGSSAGTRSSRPPGASQSSAGRGPCQRTGERHRSGAQRHAAFTVIDCPSHSGGNPGSRSTAPRLAHEHRAQVGEEPRGLGPGVAAAAPPTDRRGGRASGPGGARTSRAGPSRRRLRRRSPSLRARRRPRVRSRRGADRRGPHRRRADRRRELGLHAALQLQVPAARDRVGVGQRAHVERRARQRGAPASCGAQPGTTTRSPPAAHAARRVHGAPRRS